MAATAGVDRIDDYNGASQEGVSVMQQNAAGGLRYSSSIGYLGKQDLPGLTILTRTHIARIVIEGGRAVGVEVTTETGRETDQGRQGGDPAAGVFGSPQLLMLSGVGPAAHLREHGIDVVADLPVGDNLHDHMFVPLTYVMKSARNRGTTPYFVGGILSEAVRGDTWMGRSVFEMVGFVRSSLAGPVPDIQLHALPWSYPFPNQDAPDQARGRQAPRADDLLHADLPQEPRHAPPRLRRPRRRPADRPRVPDRAGRHHGPARRDGADPRGDEPQAGRGRRRA